MARPLLVTLGLCGFALPCLGQGAAPGAPLAPHLGFRLHRATPAGELALLQALQGRGDQELSPQGVCLVSPLSRRWPEVFEGLALDEFGLPRCAVTLLGTATEGRLLCYIFTPSPTLEALARSLGREIGLNPTTPRELEHWHRLHDRVTWLRMAQTLTVTLRLSNGYTLVGVEVRSPWGQATQSPREQEVFRAMRTRIEGILYGRGQ